MYFDDRSSKQDCIVYFDNASTSFPKPREVVDSVLDAMLYSGGNPGRSGHRLSIAAGSILFSLRQALADFFGIANPMRCIVCPNATEALNLAILGMYHPGDHVITSSMEHNSVIRPLKHLEKQGRISLTVAQCTPEEGLDPEKLDRLITPKTSLLVVNHASNVTGTVQPLRDIGLWCRDNKITFIVDGSQSCGTVPIHLHADCIDLLAFSGHKGLYGPMGSGGLIISDDFDTGRLRPLKFGGTGSSSDKIEQPAIIPDRFESGTPGVPALSGLLAGLTHIQKFAGGLQGVHDYKKELTAHFMSRAAHEIEGFLPSAPLALIETGVISFNLAGLSPSYVARELDERWGILCRAGLHCSPLAHQSIGTYPRGTLRFSFGLFNTKAEIDVALEALKTIQAEAVHA